MNRLKHLRVFSLIIAGFLLAGTAAKADPALSFTLVNPDQSSVSGAVVAFEATVTNPTNVGDADAVVIYLNSDGYNINPVSYVSGPSLSVDDSPYNNDPNFWVLNPGNSYTGLLFNLDIPLGASPGLYQGYFSILGEIDPVGSGNGGATDVVGTADFSVNVNNTTTGEDNLVPEPSSLVLLLTGMAGFAGILRRRLI
jgi:hypothetical protein